MTSGQSSDALFASGARVGRLAVGTLGLRLADWDPADGRASRGTVVIVHGLSEFIEKYLEVIGELRGRGFAVRMADLPGHGHSDRLLADRLLADRRPAYIDDMTRLVDSVAAMVDTLPDGRSGPRILLAHSMGGHVALRYLHDYPGRIDRAVLSAPMIDILLAPLLRPVLPLLARLAVSLGLGGRYLPTQSARTLRHIPFRRNVLTRDPVRFQSMQAWLARDPELGVSGVTWGWLHAALTSIAITRRPGFVEAIQTPLLVGLVGDERLVDNDAIRSLVQRLPQAALMAFPDAKHEVLQERDVQRARFWQHFDQFLGVDHDPS